MHPAYSVIFFTVSSGAGYGLLIWASLVILTGDRIFSSAGTVSLIVSMVIGLAMVVAGLLSSTFHLGHPERAWRAFSQWRSSWLSREGVMAVLGFAPALGLLVMLFLKPEASGVKIAAILVLVFSLLTVYCTAMIYASLTPIPRWNNSYVPVVYMFYAIASGAVLLCMVLSFGVHLGSGALVATAIALTAAWIVKYFYWRSMQQQSARFTAESATGLGAFGKVRVLEAPHTSANYLQKEMGFKIARKHAQSLKRIAIHSGWTAPVIALAVASLSTGILQSLLLVLATVTVLGSLLVERWLFFAEAEHAVTLYYGNSSV